MRKQFGVWFVTRMGSCHPTSLQSGGVQALSDKTACKDVAPCRRASCIGNRVFSDCVQSQAL